MQGLRLLLASGFCMIMFLLPSRVEAPSRKTPGASLDSWTRTSHPSQHDWKGKIGKDIEANHRERSKICTPKPNSPCFCLEHVSFGPPQGPRDLKPTRHRCLSLLRWGEHGHFIPLRLNQLQLRGLGLGLFRRSPGRCRGPPNHTSRAMDCRMGPAT